MSSHRPTSLNDHCNSIPSSWSVIHSEPLLNIPGCYGDSQAFITLSSQLHSLCVRISEQDVWCWWLTGTDFW